MKVEFNAKFAAEPVDIVSETLDRYETQRAVESASLSWLMPLMFAPILAEDAFAAERSANILADWSAADDIFAAFEADTAAMPEASPNQPANFTFTEANLASVDAIDLLGQAESLYTINTAGLLDGVDDTILNTPLDANTPLPAFADVLTDLGMTGEEYLLDWSASQSDVSSQSKATAYLLEQAGSVSVGQALNLLDAGFGQYVPVPSVDPLSE